MQYKMHYMQISKNDTLINQNIKRIKIYLIYIQKKNYVFNYLKRRIRRKL